MDKLKWINWVARILLVVGGLNWGLVGFFQIDLVATFLGGGDATMLVPRVVYSLVGLSAVWMIYGFFKKS